MDDAIIAVYRQIVLRCQASAEDILEDPDLRNAFLVGVRQTLAQDLPERAILHRLSSLRKQRKLPRSRDLIVP